LRGKILNVASASADKMRANQELLDIILALGAGSAAPGGLVHSDPFQGLMKKGPRGVSPGW